MDTIIETKRLSVAAQSRFLLENTSIQIKKNKITLLVGGSGGGKTVLLKLLSGLIRKSHPGFEITGEILFEEKDILLWGNYKKCHEIGIVFQDYGLLDNYSIEENIDFAFSHSKKKISKKERKSTFLSLCDRLKINPQLRIQHASGGQKRRIAIARTLAYNPDVIIYDEPTAGLDPQMAKNVASLIKKTHHEFSKKSSIIVTHDYEEFLPIADNIFFLDPQKKDIYEVDAKQLQCLIEEGRLQVPFQTDNPKKFSQKVTAKANVFFEQTYNFCTQVPLQIFQSMVRTIPLWKSQRWGARFFFHYFKMLTFLSSCLYLIMAGAIIGSVSAYFSLKFLPYRHITRQLITEDVLAALGFGLYRVIVPIFTSILIAARSGAAIASDIGNRLYLQETDSMRSMSTSPSSYLQTGTILAFLISVPFLTILTFLVAKFSCLLVFNLMHPEYHPILSDAIFHRLLRDGGEFFFIGTSWLIVKSLVCGWGLANICYFIGMRTKGSTKDISRDITLSVIAGTLFVMVAHSIFAIIEFSKRTY